MKERWIAVIAAEEQELAGMMNSWKIGVRKPVRRGVSIVWGAWIASGGGDALWHRQGECGDLGAGDDRSIPAGGADQYWGGGCGSARPLVI